MILTTEYARFHADAMVDLPDGSTETERLRQEGYYLSLMYQLTDWWGIGAYYSVHYPDIDDKDGKKREAFGGLKEKAWYKEFVFSTRLDLNDSWIVKFEGHVIDGASMILYEDNPDGIETHSFLFAMKTTFHF